MGRKKNERNEASRTIAKAILEQYKPTTKEQMQDALRDIFGPIFEAILKGEMDSRLGKPMIGEPRAHPISEMDIRTRPF